MSADSAEPEQTSRCIVAIATAAQRCARYGTLIAWAKQLGRSDCASMLQKNLDEEKAADKNLTAAAESPINRKAA